MALSTRLLIRRRKRTVSSSTSVGGRFTSAFSSMFFSSACGRNISTMAEISSSRLAGSSSRVNFCWDRLLISRRLSIRDIRWPLASSTCPSISARSFGSSVWFFARAVKPVMAFIGVRMSWEMLNRNEDLISLARFSRSSSASISIFSESSCWTRAMRSVTLRKPRTTLFKRSSSRTRTTDISI